MADCCTKRPRDEARAEVPLLKSLPEPPPPPEGTRPHDSHQDTDLTSCYPYVVNPEIRSLDVEVHFQPSSTVPLQDFHVQAAAHFHGVSHSQGTTTRFPYVDSCVENARAPVRGLQLMRVNAGPAAHCVSCRCKLTQVPLGVSCILLTLSCYQLNALKSMRVDVFKPHPEHGRYRFAHKQVDRDALARILTQAQMDGGTLTVMALVQNCGWWHIYSFQSFFDNQTASDFIMSACRPRTKGDPAITKAEKLLGYMQMFKPLTRRIKVHALEAFQLPIAQVSMFKKCLCQGKSPSVQSRIVGEYIEEVSGKGAAIVANSRRPNAAGRVDFQQVYWIADRVMASDARRMDITLVSRPDGVTDYGGPVTPSDPHFLGTASFGLAQVWALLEQGNGRCRLQLKLGPPHLKQCTGSVVLGIMVEQEPFDKGVEYM